ncbi:MAG: tetratricopeptide repeat protein [Pseudohongiella sp.]|nr:tetratricopeptide repeat protein [Pseudohongiella sp.]
MSPSVDQILRKAKSHASKGETDLAAQKYESILQKYPQNQQAIAGLKALKNIEPPPKQTNALIALYNQGQLQQALDYGEALEKQFPHMLLIPNILGATNVGLGRFEQALANYTKALQIDPDNDRTHNNLGIVLNDLGKTNEAVISFTKALQINPGFAEAHNNLGNGLKDLGKLEEAVVSYAKAVQIQADHAEAHNNLGVVLSQLGKPEEAVASYTKALQIKPDYAEAHNGLGIALNDLGKDEEALVHSQKAVALAPERKEFWQSFSRLLQGISFKEYEQRWADIFLGILHQKTVVRPAQTAKPILHLLKQHPSIRKALQVVSSDDMQNTALEVCDSLSEIPLLLRLMELSPIFDLDVERLLKTLRRALLLSAVEVVDGQGVLSFQLSLALHCFTNEYVFAETDEEALAVQALETNVEQQLSAGEQPSPFAIVCLASYRPLHSFGWAQQVLVPESLKALFERQLNEGREEAAIRTKIRTFGESDDQVSKAVQAQYEENPYPRWVNTALSPKPLSIHEFVNTLKLKLSDKAGSFAIQPEILIAGCGTGQHSLGTATRFLNSKVLAIDLSLSSLSYAIRKTQELGITNIEYLQADILKLDSMDKQFDLIESVGVLHHMADPMAGWKILTDRLKPGGLMRIGLYSELARASVVAAREIISEMGLSQTTREMLKFRSAVLDSNEEMFAKIGEITKWSDFSSTSELRDLLFHVQEHRFTLPQIKQSLEVLGLSFAGFEFGDKKILGNFMQQYTDPQSVYSLDAWHEFELAHVDTFAGMYQFWLQKNAD